MDANGMPNRVQILNVGLFGLKPNDGQQAVRLYSSNKKCHAKKGTLDLRLYKKTATSTTHRVEAHFSQRLETL
jgi:hypothetical protein